VESSIGRGGLGGLSEDSTRDVEDRKRGENALLAAGVPHRPNRLISIAE
jgi:hypothetical protein